MNYFLDALGKYATFSGRARRSEYWYFFLFCFLIAMLLYAGGLYVAKASGGPPTLARYLVDFFSLVILVPNIAVSVRRLHDIGMSGWWWFLSLVPLGGFVLLYFYAREGQPGPNVYGPDPKQLTATA